jgi:hypothetical protein
MLTWSIAGQFYMLIITCQIVIDLAVWFNLFEEGINQCCELF